MAYSEGRKTWLLLNKAMGIFPSFLNVVILLIFLYLQFVNHTLCSSGTVDPNLPYSGTLQTCYTASNVTWAKQRQLSGLNGEYGSFGCPSIQGRAIYSLSQPVGCSYTYYVSEKVPIGIVISIVVNSLVTCGMYKVPHSSFGSPGSVGISPHSYGRGTKWCCSSNAVSCINYSKGVSPFRDENQYPWSGSHLSQDSITGYYCNVGTLLVPYKGGAGRCMVIYVEHCASHIRCALPYRVKNYIHLICWYNKHRCPHRQLSSFSHHEMGCYTYKLCGLIHYMTMLGMRMFTYHTLCNPFCSPCYSRTGTYVLTSAFHSDHLPRDTGRRNLAGNTRQDLDISMQAEAICIDKSCFRRKGCIMDFHPDSHRICMPGHATNTIYVMIICVPLGFSPAFLCVEHCSGYSAYLTCPSDIYGWTGCKGYLIGMAHNGALDPASFRLLAHRLRMYGCTLCGAWGRHQCLKSHLRAPCTTEAIKGLGYYMWFHPSWGHIVDYCFDCCVNHLQWMAKFKIGKGICDLVALLPCDCTQYSPYRLGFSVCMECKGSLMSCNRHRRVQST